VKAGNETTFSTAAFRVGHTLLSPVLLRLESDGRPIAAGNLALQDAFFSPGQIQTNGGIEPLLMGLAGQRAQEIDNKVVDDVRNFMFGAPGAGGLDLASLNIQRGRDHGLPSYNQTRLAYGLAPATRVADVSSSLNVQANLAAAYSSVDDIDLWIGGLAEDHVPGAMVGETFFTVLRDQFQRLRDGDRFWYENSLPASLLDMVKGQTLAQVIRRNTGMESEIQEHVFIVPTVQPLLTLRKTGPALQVMWPAMYTDMTLQMATGLLTPDWTNVPTLGNEYIMSAGGPAQFFRLAKE
jgi:hypothetical protein